MGVVGRRRRFFGIGLKYAPRVVAGALALFSLLVSHQLIWTAFAELTRRLAAPRLWLLTSRDAGDLLNRILSEPSESLTTTDEAIELEVIAPPDARVDLLQNGRYVSALRRAGGRTDAKLRLRRGRNLVVATATGPGPSERTSQDLEIQFQSPRRSDPWILARQKFSESDANFYVVGFAEPGSEVSLGYDDPATGLPKTTTTDRVGSYTRDVSSSSPDLLKLVAAAGNGRGFLFVDPGRWLRRTVSFRIDADTLAITASLDLAGSPALSQFTSTISTLSGGEFLWDVFGLCLDSTEWANEEAEHARLGSLSCASRPQLPLPAWDFLQIESPDRIQFERDVPLSSAALGVRLTGDTALSQTFLSLPEETLRVEYAPAVAGLVRVERRGFREEESARVWDTNTEFTTYNRPVGVVFRVGTTRQAEPGRAPESTETAGEADSPQESRRPMLIDRIRTLEELLPIRIRRVFDSLVSAIPFLYFLWILHTFPARPRAHVATIRAVMLTFLVLHLSIVAVSLVEASFNGPTFALLGAMAPNAAWSRGVQVLRSASYLYPFLAIGMVLLVHPVFRALRRSALEPPRRSRPVLRGLGWITFWVAVIGIPAGTISLLASVDYFSDVTQRMAPLGGALLVGFAALWIVLFWLFRGVFRIRLGVRHSMQASWAMLLLPVVPLVADGTNELLRRIIATQAHLYPLMLPDRASPYVAAAIVTLLGAILLRQTGELSVRLSQHAGAFRWWRAHRGAILIGALVIGIPVATDLSPSVFGFSDFLNDMDRLLPYALLIGAVLLVRLYNPADSFDIPMPVVQIGALLFAWYVTRGGATLLFVPVPFLMAWLLLRRFLIAPRPAVTATTPATVAAFLDERRARSRLESLQRGLDKKFTEGELKLADYTERLTEGQAAVASSSAALTTAAGGAEVQVFGYGPENSPGANAIVAVSYGMVISAPFQLFTLVRMLEGGWGGGRFPLLEFSYALLYSVITWLAMAGVFGYFFHVIRGRNGFEKAIWFSLCTVLPTIPLRLVAGQSLLGRGQILDIVQVVAFTLVLALVAFDLRTLRKHFYGWRELMTVYGLASAAYGSTIAIATVSALGGKEILSMAWTWLTQ